MLADRPLAHVAVRCASLSLIVFVAALPVYVWVEPSWRGLVARLGCAIVLGAAFLQLRRVLTERLAAEGGSALDAARLQPEPEAGVPHHFLDLKSDVSTALRSRRYFETVLWPRLEALAGRPLVPPARRRGRGPSLAGIRAVLAAIERRP